MQGKEKFKSLHIGNSLSKENIANVLEDTSINRDKVHPMEFYIYPIIGREFENGDIVQDNNSGEVFVILTPSCDFVERFDGGGRSLGRKAENVLLAQATLLCDRDELKNYLETRSKSNKNKLAELVTSKNDRYFFLPGTPFIRNRVVDFQNKKVTILFSALT